MVAVHVLHQELIIIYKILSTLGFILEEQKLFKIMQTLCLVHVMLTQLENAKSQQCWVYHIWNIAWKMIIKTTYRFIYHQEINITVTSHQAVSLQCHHHHQVIMWLSLLKLAICSARLLYSLPNEHCNFLSK